MDKKILNDNFSEEERKLLIFCYQVEETIKTIRRLKSEFPDNLEDTYYDEYVETVKKVYSVLKRATEIFPDDERMKEWKDLIQQIENEKLSLHLDKYKQTFNDDFPTIPFDSLEDEEIIDIIDNCIKKSKDVYELGYLELDDIMY